MRPTDTAIKKAEVLLREHLTPEQLADYDDTDAFNVRGSDGRLYRLKPHANPNHDALVSEVTVQRGGVGGCDCRECRRYRNRDPYVYVQGLSVYLLAAPSVTGGGATFTEGYPAADWGLATMLMLQTHAEHLRAIACKDTMPMDRSPQENGGDYDGAI